MAETKITILVPESLRREAKAAAALRTDSVLSLRFSGGPGDVAERAEEILEDAVDRAHGFGDVG